jgi:hypothetical protein
MELTESVFVVMDSDSHTVVRIVNNVEVSIDFKEE